MTRMHPFRSDPGATNALVLGPNSDVCAAGVERPGEVIVPEKHIHTQLHSDDEKEMKAYIQHLVAKQYAAQHCLLAAREIALHYLKRYKAGFQQFYQIVGELPRTAHRETMRWL